MKTIQVHIYRCK